MFLEKINHVTGEREWEVAEEDHDLAQEIARSRFADMILDYNRNDMFLAGLRTVIQEKKKQGTQAHVMDIGTGTGLLSLMAAREGADKVTAVEVFQPMADCARSIVEASEWHDKIEVIPFRSTELSPLSSKPNIIVAEVFDTELIGEGALRTFKEALTKHVQPNCRVVPSRARVWVQPVESAFLSKFNRIPRFAEGDCPLGKCPGTSAVFDVQLSQLKQHQFTRLTEAFLAFTFDFESPQSIVYDESFDRTALCTQSGQVDAIFMWWDLDMDGTGKLWIDMSPKWSSNDYHWRDHWMQAVYYLPQQVHVEKGETLSLKCSHDEFSMWFSVGTDCVERIYCNCQLHTIMARQSIFSANEILEDVQFRDEVKAICEGRNAIVVGEGSMLFLLVAPVGSAVTVVDSNPHFRDIISKYVSFYNFKNVTIVESVADVSTEPDVVVGEPFYLSAMTPWQNLRFWYDVTALQERFGRNITIQPQNAVLYGICERFDHLQNTGAPVGVVNGFDLSLFDDISQKARQATDALVDIHPLWEYEGVVSGEKFEVLRFDLRQEPSDVEANFTIPSSHGTNGIPLWTEWHFGNITITTGLKHDVGIGEVPEWKEGVRQGVYLLSPTLLTKSTISVDARFARGADLKERNDSFPVVSFPSSPVRCFTYGVTSLFIDPVRQFGAKASHEDSNVSRSVHTAPISQQGAKASHEDSTASKSLHTAPISQQGAKASHEDSTASKSLHTAPISQVMSKSIDRSLSIEKPEKISTTKMTRSREDQRRQSKTFATSKSRPRSRMGSISIDVSESRTQLTEKRVRPPSRRSTRMRREESSRMKSVMTQRDDATLKSLNVRQLSRVVAVEPTLTMQAVKEREIKQQQVKPNEIKLRAIKDIEELMKPAGTQEDEIVTLTRLDEDPTVVRQKTPNRYEKMAGQKQMVVDPLLVTKRGNIDNIYTRMKTQFTDQLRDVELPSDRETPEKPQAEPATKGIKFKDDKCVVYETNDEPTIDDVEDAAEPEADLY